MTQMLKSSSAIISAFTQANHELQLKQDQKIYDSTVDNIKKRRQKIQDRQGIVIKKEEVKIDASKSEKFKTMDEHKISLEDLKNRLNTDLQKGLTTPLAQQKMIEIGKNVLTPKKKTPWFVKLLHEFISDFNLLMWVGSALCYLIYGLSPTDPSNLYVGVVLDLVVIVSSLVSFFQNAKSEAIMEAFQNFIPPETLVIRDGVKQKLPAERLVPGDIVIVENGKRIPADIRIIESNGMKVDNSSLTGESLLLIRSSECTNEDNPLETKNLAFFGTLCKEGSGTGIVIFTGDHTVIGQIANLASSAGNEETPLRKEMKTFTKIIAAISIGLGVTFFSLGFILKYRNIKFIFILVAPITNLIFAIGLIAANVPEGVIAAITVSLSLTAKRLATFKVLVKNLEGVETLGSTSCICSDKTGTLTQNKMTVENIWYDSKKRRAHNYQKMGKGFNYEYKINDQGFVILQECAVMCSEATFDSSLPQDIQIRINAQKGYNQDQKQQQIREAQQKWDIELEKLPWLERPTNGDASETALIKFFQPIKNIEEIRNKFQIVRDSEGKIAKMPFNSTNKYAFLIVEYETLDSHYCLFTKGAPERIWGLCETVYNQGELERRDETWNKRFQQINEQFGKNGERVLGFAKYHLPKSQFQKGFNFNIDHFNFPFNQQSFIGLISMIDPPKYINYISYTIRDSVPFAVIKCKTAGIKVIMVTGDQPVTAAAIAKQCNIITEKTANEISEEEGISFEEACKKSNAIVIHGDRLTKMARDDEGLPEDEKGRLLSEWLDKPQIVFARTSPAQKLIIVSGCQKKGHIVAVTGDGVNDSPAIKKADIGIAMGITGSDVAKDAADMILLNDDFSSIVIGIEEGRKIFDNLKKSISYCLTSNVPELIPFIALIIFQFPLPLSSIFVLLISVGTDLIPSVGFCWEESEMDIMLRRPRHPEQHLVDGKLMMFAYAQQGIQQAFIGWLSYFIVMNDFGMPGQSLFQLGSYYGMIPEVAILLQIIYCHQHTDTYDPNSPWLGNSKLKNLYTNRINDQPIQNGIFCIPEEEDESAGFEVIDWLYNLHGFADLRMTLVTCDEELHQWKEMIDWGECYINQISPITERPVCWSTEALKYAQTGFFCGCVWGQVTNFLSTKALKSSIFFSGLKNFFMFFSYSSELIIVLCIMYIKPFNYVLGSRDLIYRHAGTCGLIITTLLILWNEIRKYFINNYKSKNANYPSFWQRCIAL